MERGVNIGICLLEYFGQTGGERGNVGIFGVNSGTWGQGRNISIKLEQTGARTVKFDYFG